MQVPDLTTVVNHMGFAGVPGGTLPEFTWWANIMSLLATLPNVYVKISGGQVMPVLHHASAHTKADDEL